MVCTLCGSQAAGNFCSTCGHQLPVIVGGTYPYGFRFPEPKKTGIHFQAVMNHVWLAPVYRVEFVGDTKYHVCLFDRQTVRDLCKLLQLVQKAVRDHDLIEHTTDGETFSNYYMQWACFADRVNLKPPRHCFEQFNVRCHSYFGCSYALDRFNNLHLDQGWETFTHGAHGHFCCSMTALRHIEEGRVSPSLKEELESVPFELDKRAIEREIISLLQKRNVLRCPAYSLKYLQRQIEKLPDLVQPNAQWGVIIYPAPGVYFQCYEERRKA